jgi:hypothetical protein
MKPRRLTVTVEMTTDAPRSDLVARFKRVTCILGATNSWSAEVHQVQVNVIRPERTSGKARRGRAGR